ncbi:MAG: DUF3810 domain-containing protein [Chitinophagaceae bacterium]|nr:DUF3810 domain-containing protein [Chitinophagaceae bacterium]
MQKIIARFFSKLMKSKSWVLVILLSVFIKWVSLYPDWVERNYSNTFYPLISRLQRFLFGWIPFSIGDLLYIFFCLIILYKTGNLIKTLWRRKFTRSYMVTGLQHLLFFVLLLYVVFNLCWGLNYNRKGIAWQLGLHLKRYSLQDLDTLAVLLQEKTNYYAQFATKTQRDSLNRKKILFQHAVNAFRYSSYQYPYLAYKIPSIKPSLFSYLGNYLGFQGYYNAFSGEAQVNTTIPRFMEPFVTLHEVAHQVGYAKENEANFVAYLAGKEYEHYAFRYSIYNGMYMYALDELSLRDSARAKALFSSSHPQVKADAEEFRNYLRKYKNPIEPVIMWFYNHYLKANNQPSGKRSYQEVVVWLIAYYKKYGKEAL